MEEECQLTSHFALVPSVMWNHSLLAHFISRNNWILFIWYSYACVAIQHCFIFTNICFYLCEFYNLSFFQRNRDSLQIKTIWMAKVYRNKIGETIHSCGGTHQVHYPSVKKKKKVTKSWVLALASCVVLFSLYCIGNKSSLKPFQHDF